MFLLLNMMLMHAPLDIQWDGNVFDKYFHNGQVDTNLYGHAEANE